MPAVCRVLLAGITRTLPRLGNGRALCSTPILLLHRRTQPGRPRRNLLSCQAETEQYSRFVHRFREGHGGRTFPNDPVMVTE
jgi:hypothetical protein